MAQLAGTGLTEEQQSMQAAVLIEANRGDWAILCVGAISDQTTVVTGDRLAPADALRKALALDDRDWTVGAPLPESFLVSDLASPASNAATFQRRTVEVGGEPLVCLVPGVTPQ
jgi:hypothetical protein